MPILRRAATALCLIVTILATLGWQMDSMLGRNVVSAERFADVAVSALDDADARDAIAQSAVERLPFPSVRDRLQQAVSRALAEERVRAAVRTRFVRAHPSFLDDPSQGIRIPTVVVRDDVIAELGRLFPAIDLPRITDADFPVVTIPLPQAAQATVTALDRSSRLRDALPLIAVAAGLLCVALSTRRIRMLLILGWTLVAVSAVPAVIRVTLPDALVAASERSTGAVARRVADALTADWQTATVIPLVVGVVALAVAMLSRRPAFGRSRKA